MSGYGRRCSVWNDDVQTARESSEPPSAQQNSAASFENQTRMPGCQARQSQLQPLTTWSLARACRLTICTAADRGSQHDGFFRTCFPQHSRHARLHCCGWMDKMQCWPRREEEQQHHHRLRSTLRSRYITVVHAVEVSSYQVATALTAIARREGLRGYPCTALSRH